MPTTITSAGVTFNDTTTLTSANGVPSALKLTTARTINGVSFDGTANITVPNSTFATAQTISSGSTIVDFTGIPSTAKRITVIFKSISNNAAAAGTQSLIRLGTSAGIIASGYAGGAVYYYRPNAVVNETGTSSGFMIIGSTNISPYSGTMELINITGNTWVLTGVNGDASTTYVANTTYGHIDLSGTLDRIRFTVNAGTFTGGVVNIAYA